MLIQEQIIDIFEKSHAMLNGHFLLTSGMHSNQYFQCAQVLQYPHYSAQLCQQLAERFKNAGVQTVVGPATGGILVAYELARQLKVRSLFTERENGKMALRRGFNIEPGEKVLVAEDVVTTGGSVREVMAVMKECGAEVLGVAVLVDRSGGTADFGVPTAALLTTQVVTYQPDECPLCKEGLPLVKPGSRKFTR